MPTVRVALIQKCPPAEPSGILDDAAHWTRAAAAQSADLIVFPELYYPGFHTLMSGDPDRTDLPREFSSLAESVPGPVTHRISSLAVEASAFIVFTLLERSADNNRCHNSSILVSPAGEILHVHRKTMLTPGIDTGLTPGNSYDVVETPLGRIGLLICADGTCPEPARLMALQAADIVCLSSGDFHSKWRVNGKDLVEQFWLHSSASSSRAVDNNLFWIAVNGAGLQGGTKFFGGSRAIAPTGEVIVEAPFGPDKQGLSIADLDLGLRADVARMFSLIERRRPELYHPLTTSQAPHR